MEGSYRIPHLIVCGCLPDAHPGGIELINKTLAAVTPGAELTAGVAADAAAELLLPEGPLVRNIFAFHFFDIFERGGNTISRLTDKVVIHHWCAVGTALAAFLIFFAYLVPGHIRHPLAYCPDDIYLLADYLLLVYQQIHRARVTRFD